MKKAPLHPGFAAIWIIWRTTFVVACALASLFRPLDWLMLLSIFVLVEAIGVIRDGKGDTASETHWAVGAKGWAWRLWSVGFAGAYVFQLWALPGMFGIESSPAWAMICFGMFGWLGAHFFFLGKHG